jgi:hypothetical protein
VLGSEDAVGASGGLASVEERAAVSFGNDGVLEALGPDGVVVVHGAVVELAEAE